MGVLVDRYFCNICKNLFLDILSHISLTLIHILLISSYFNFLLSDSSCTRVTLNILHNPKCFHSYSLLSFLCPPYVFPRVLPFILSMSALCLPICFILCPCYSVSHTIHKCSCRRDSTHRIVYRPFSVIWCEPQKSRDLQ